MPSEIRHEVRRWPHIRRIVGADVTRYQEPIAADAGIHRHVLLPVGTGVGNGGANHARPDLEAVKQLAAPGVRRSEPPIEGAIEHDVSSRGHASAPHGVFLSNLPDFPSLCGIPGDECPEVPAGTRRVWNARADVGSPDDVRRLGRLPAHAEVVGGDVKETGAGRVGRRRGRARPAFQTRTDILDVPPRCAGQLRGIELRPTRREIDSPGPVDVHKRLGDQHLTGGAVDGVREAALVEMHQDSASRALNREVGQNHLRVRVVIPTLVRRELVGPDQRAVRRPPSHDAAGPLVVTQTLFRIVGSRVAGTVIQQVEVRIVRDPSPHGHTRQLPRIARPTGEPQLRALIVERFEGVGVGEDLAVRASVVARPENPSGLEVEGLDPALDPELAP